MIKAERLKELIEKEATIYNVQCDKLVRKINFADKSEGTYVVGEIESINSSDFVLELNNENENVFAWTLEQLYKTKADAEFQAEFGDVKKVIKMPVPPTWEEFCEDYSDVWVVNPNTQENIFVAIDNETENYIQVILDKEIVYSEVLTKVNYIKALDKMVELWREEV